MDSLKRRQLCRVLVDPEDEIVISGIAGRFPKSHNVAELSHNLFNKIYMVGSNKGRFKHFNSETPDYNGFTYDLDKFDANFFSINHRSAMFMDAQQRMILEHAYEAILDAGICPKQLRGSKTGVFTGCISVEADEFLVYSDITKDGLGLLGSERSLLSNRVSFSLDFKGQSFTVDTACSSSGYALDLAYSAIRSGECEAAIVASSNLLISEATTVQFARLGLLPDDGICSPFDDNAHGFARSESVNILFLQKRKDAKRVYATVVHSKTNIDGFKNEGLTFPSTEVQMQLFKDLYEEIGINPNTVDFIEAHATATRIGDPPECNSIDKVFCADRTEPLLVGSIKSNLGHTEASALSNSVIKSILIFENGKIPPNLHYVKPRKDIPALVAGRLKPVTDVMNFNGNLIGVNSFGFGGANSHVLLRKNSKDKINNGFPTDNIPRLVVWSGRTEEALNTIFDSITMQPFDAEYIALLHNTQISTQLSNTYRGYAIYTKNSESSDATCVERHIINFGEERRPLVFVFSGMGSQWPCMGADLMNIPIFADSIKRCHDILAKKGIDLIKIITTNDKTIFDNILHSFVGISAIQIGLTNVLKAVGLEADYIIGHSLGELGCGYADNCMTDEEMIMYSYARGIISTENKTIFGSMAAVGIGYKDIKSMLDEGIYVACHNSSDSCTISGPAEKVALFVEKLRIKNIFAKEVKCSNIAYHSPYIAHLGPKLKKLIASIISEPKLRSQKWISTSAPKSRWDSIECKYSSVQYHVDNLLNPVLFEEGCDELPRNALTIEIAPHGLLQAIMKRSLPNGLHFSLTKIGSTEGSMLLYRTLGKLFENGVDLDLSKLYPAIDFPVSRGTPMISPFIKWNHDQTYHVSTYDTKLDTHKVYNLVEPEYDFILGHDIDGLALFPATGYLYLAWKTLAFQLRVNFLTLDVEFEDVKFIRACQVKTDRDQKLTVVVQPQTGSFQVSEGDSTLVTGIIRPYGNYKLTEIEISNDPNIPELNSSDFYKELRLRGYQYKKLFKSVVSAKIDSSSGKVKWHSNWVAFLDCLLQIPIISKDIRALGLPIGIDKVIIKRNEHEKLMSELGENPIAEVKYCSKLKALRCGGVEIRGLMVQTVNRRPPKGIPVIESYQFVSHFPTPCLSKIEAARFIVQLAVENALQKNMPCVEIDINDNRDPFCEYMALAFNDFPIIRGEFNYLTSKEIEIPYTTVSQTELSSFNNLMFIIRSNCLFDGDFLETVKQYIGDHSYVISREQKDFNVHHDTEELQGYKIAAIIATETENLVVMQFRKESLERPKPIINITNTDQKFSWLDDLKIFATTEPTIVYSQGDSFSGILGLANCIRREPGGKFTRCVFIDDASAPPFNIDDPFYKAQLNKDLAMNVYRNGQWGSYKHNLVTQNYKQLPCDVPCYANCLTRGDLSSIKWLQSPIKIDDEQIISVQYASLNFRDVMLATGKLSIETVADNRLELMCIMGLEYSGVTKDGRRIMGINLSGDMASHVDPDDVFVFKVPDLWTLEEAATVPLIYCTVYEAFFVTTQIKKGHSILIHAGAGGVGLAAIQVALSYGLEVFTTVSTEEKKDFLLNEYPQLKRENIGNSRDTSFEDMVMTCTCGKGVDYVLNSLAEEKLAASIRCLGENGKFLEIGKFDISKNNKLNLGDFIRGISYHPIFVDRIFKASEERKLLLKKLVDDGIANGIVKPIKANVFDANNIEHAFRLLASGKHIGKVVLKIRESEFDEMTLPISYLPRIYCDPHQSYIICGGLGGFGMELADWLIFRGCRKIILSTSRGITQQYQTYRINIWKSYGVTVQVNKSDITTKDGCEKLINDALKLGPIEGIFNLAVQLRDNILENQTVEKFNESMGPKAYATKYLDEISRSKCPNLKYFVIFSSVSCGRGNGGQTNYGLANSVMERIMEERHKLGLPAKGIQWGAIGDVGIVAVKQEENIEIEIGGTLLQSIHSCLDELDLLMTTQSPLVASMVVAEKRIQTSGKSGVIEMLMNIMSIKDLKSVSLGTKLSELGMDSLMTVEISQTLERDFNIILTPQQIRSMTLAQFKSLENKKEDTVEKKSKLNLEFLIKNLGDESTSHMTILKINENSEINKTKALIFPGIEGVCGAVYYDLAKSIKYPTYLLQCLNICNISDINEMCNNLIEDVAKLYKCDSEFLLIGYSYGGLLALKLAKMLEDLGKSGRVILIDTSPSLFKQIVSEMSSGTKNDDKLIQEYVLDTFIKYMYPDDKSNRKNIILEEPSWDAKLKKCSELYENFGNYSKEFIFKAKTLVKNRLTALLTISLDDNSLIKSPIKLIKPTESLVQMKEEDFGLNAFSTKEIKVTTFEGNHRSILEHEGLLKIINE